MAAAATAVARSNRVVLVKCDGCQARLLFADLIKLFYIQYY